MKKLIVCAAALAGLTLTSCKKDYTCTCTYGNGTSTVNAGTYTIHDTKSNARSQCDQKASASGSNVSYTCTL